MCDAVIINSKKNLFCGIPFEDNELVVADSQLPLFKKKLAFDFHIPN